MPKRGLIVLIVVWSVLLLAPMFRSQSRRTIQNLGSDNRSFYQLRDDWAAIKKANPDNAQVAFQDLQKQNYPRTPQYWRDLDALVARFPDDLNLRRARIMESMRPGKLVRMTHSIGKIPLADSTDSKDQPTAEQRASLVAAARAGQAQAPNDGFFPWMEAMTLWDQNEEPALQALERAAKDSKFDDGIMANARALIALHETQNSLDADEKIAMMWNGLFPHYAIMREMARQVTWSGIAHYKRGDKAGAYRRWRAVLQASAAFRRAQSHGPQANLIALFVAEAMEKLVWGNVAEEFNPPAKIPRSGAVAEDVNAARSAARLRNFVQLARRDGQNELADYALRENASFEGVKLSGATLNYLSWLGFESPVTMASLQLPWLERLVFWLSVAGALALLVCLVWRYRVGGARWFGASGAQIAFFGALWLSALALAFWGRTASQLQQFGGYNDDAMSLSAQSMVFSFFDTSGMIWACILGTLALSVALCYRQNARETQRLQSQILPRNRAATSGAWLPKLSVFAWSLVALSTIYLFVAGSGTKAPIALAVWSACAFVALGLSFVRIERGEAANKTRFRLVLFGVVCGLVSLGLSAQFGSQSDVVAFYLTPMSLLIALAILIYLAANSRDWRPQFAPALAVALQTLGGVAALCAVALLVASLAALPVRARQNRVVDDYIARGEIDWTRSQMQLRRASENIAPK